MNNVSSSIYVGQIRHRRFQPKVNTFGYSLYMLALNLNDAEQTNFNIGPLGTRWFYPLRFKQQDYIKTDIKSDPTSLFQRINLKAQSLGAKQEIKQVVMLAQVRCFGLYFSPANFYFCYDEQGQCCYMLAEVSNTPWNQRHYYLVELSTDGQHKIEKPTDKVFHVSPFMDLEMKYHWQVKPPTEASSQLMVNIENIMNATEKNMVKNKVFDATLNLKKKPLTKKQLYKVLLDFPLMTLKVVGLIYWQAMKLFVKRIPFVSYQHKKEN